MSKIQLGNAGKAAFKYDVNDLTQHAVILGATGSGKTVMAKVFIEEIMQLNLPIIAIDPKGDIGSVAVTNKDFDFRPFVAKQKAAKLAQLYKQNTQPLKKIAQTKIYTPGAHHGLSFSTFPDLSVPKTEHVAAVIEPLSTSLAELAQIKSGIRHQAELFIGELIKYHWERKKNISIELLIKHILNPPIGQLGNLHIDDIIKEKERKQIAAALNSILISPAKKSAMQGNRLNVQELLQPGKLSVFDLRFTQDKQQVVEHILQQLYTFLLAQGGSTKLKYILYIDELAGLLPPPPSNPSCKKMLELLIRQARAFGLGIIVATQSPADIDYKLLGNFNTRCIGKLRTTQDMDKVKTQQATKEEIAQLETGQFIIVQQDQAKIVNSRWLSTLHEGPLTPQHIDWINNPEKQPKTTESLPMLKKATSTKKTKKTAPKKAPPKIKTITHKEIISSLKQYADTIQTKITKQADVYHPHLRIVIEAKKQKKFQAKLQGPYLFDLRTQTIPLDNYAKRYSWMLVQHRKPLNVLPLKRSLYQSCSYAIKDAQKHLKTTLYESTLFSFASDKRKEVEKENRAYLEEMAQEGVKRINKNIKDLQVSYNKKIDKNKKQISSIKSKLRAQQTKRSLKRMLGNRLAKTTTAIEQSKKKREQLEKENKKFRLEVKEKIRKQHEQIEKIKLRVHEQSISRIKQKKFSAQRKDIIVHATLLLNAKV